MSLLSIDVGLKNLSYCLFSDDKKIIDWKIINIMIPTTINNEKEIIKNKCGNKIKKNCIKIAKYIDKEGKYYCKGCSEKLGYIINNKNDFKGLTNKSLDDLKILAEKYKIEIKSCKKKKELLILLEEYKEKWELKEIKKDDKPKINFYKLDFIEIGKNIRDYFNSFLFKDVKYVIIESQMTAKMKQVQCLLAQHFISTCPNICVEFINPSNKLKKYNTDNSSYKKRKCNAVLICQEYFCKNEKEWKLVLDKEKKKDDLCDCFLQGKWYLEEKME